MKWEIAEVSAPGHAAEDAILAVLVAYNLSAAPPDNWQPFAFVIREPGAESILGGICGACFYDWCVIRLLVVPEAGRGQGLGRQLMARAEALARSRSCIGIWLDTFSFQARGFYEKLGFVAFAELEGHPRGGSRIFLQKRL